MKKNDYGEIEQLLSAKAPRLERDVNYSGAVRSAENYEGGRRERGAFFQTPAVQIISVFLVAAMVGGGTFGALKYLEYKGEQITASPGGTEATSEKQLNADVEHGFGYDDTYSYEEALSEYTKVPYEDSDAGGFAAVLTGGRLYKPQVDKISTTEKSSFDEISTALYDTAFYYGCECVFGGDLVIYNNVENRKMTELKVSLINETEKHEFKNADEAAAYLRTVNVKKEYFVQAQVTWDDTDLRDVGDKYTTYGVAFRLVITGDGADVIEKSSEFGDVRTIWLDNTNLVFDKDKGPVYEEVDIELPIENEYKNVHRLISDEVSELGLDVYVYQNKQTVNHGFCVLDSGRLVMNFKPDGLRYMPTYLLYAGDTPSGHPMLFYVDTQGLSGLADQSLLFLCACDTVTGQITKLGRTSSRFEEVYKTETFGLGSQKYKTTWSYVTYDESSKEIIYVVYETITSHTFYSGINDRTATEENVKYKDRVVYNGEKYELENHPYLEQTGDNKENAETETRDPADRVIIEVNGLEYQPLLISQVIREGGNEAEKSYSHEQPVVIEFDSLSDVDIIDVSDGKNMYITSVKVDGTEYYNLTDAFERIEETRSVWSGTRLKNYVTITATWNYKADGVYNEYTYGFDLWYTIKPDVQPPEVMLDPPAAWLKITAGDEAYRPSLLIKRTYGKDGTVSDTVYEEEDLVITYKAGDELSAQNTVRSPMHVYSVTVDQNKVFDNFEDAFEYVRAATQYQAYATSQVLAAVGWDADEINDKDAEKTEYLFSFRIKCDKTYDAPDEYTSTVRLKAGDGYYSPLPVKKTETYEDGRKDNVTYYSTEYPLFIWDYDEEPDLSVETDSVSLISITVNGAEKFYTMKEAMSYLLSQAGSRFHVEFDIKFNMEAGVKTVYTYAFDALFKLPAEETTGPVKEFETGEPWEVFNKWLKSKLFAGMRFEDLRKTVWNIDVGGYKISTDYLAGLYQQVNYEADGTFVRYGGDLYDLTWFVEKDEVDENGGTIREARLILRKGYKNFDLPFGITLEMTPAEALKQMGFTDEEIEDFAGKTTKIGNFEITYYVNSLLISYFTIEDGYMADVGISISTGNERDLYIEIERQ